MKDKVIIITGTSSGIGEAGAKLLAAKGAKVVLGARRAERLKALAEEITAAGGEAIWQVLDVTRQADNDAQKSGHVIATSSVAGLKAYPAAAVYGGTKFFVRDFMEILRMESAMEGTNIRTATIFPAAINTELLHTISDTGTAAGMAALYEQVGITPDRIAAVVAFAIEQPADTNVSELTVGPTVQAW